MSLPGCHCDHCEGVEWPAPPNMTPEEHAEIEKNLKGFPSLLGSAMCSRLDKMFMEVFR